MIGQIEANWVVPSDLASRIDAEYYQQHFIEAQSRLKTVHCVPFHTLWKESFRIYMGIKGYDGVADSHKFTPYLRPVDIDDIGFINFEHLGWCEANWLKDYGEQGTAKPNDLIVEVKGNTRKVAVLPATVPVNCIVSGSAWRIQISEKADRHFVKAFLLSETGQLLKRRQISNSIIPWIDPGAFKNLAIPLPDPKIQAYIGDKVRLAEKCREMAQTKRSQIEYRLEQHAHKSDITALLSAKPQPSHNIEAKIINDRLDAEFYQPHYLDLVQIIQARPYQKLGDVIQLPIKGVQPEYDSTGTVPALTGTDIDPYRLDLEGASRVNLEWAKGKTKALAVSNEILFTVTGPPLGEAAVVHSFQAPLVINSHVARIKTRQSFPYPFYLAALMNSIIVSAQVYRYCKGVRQKELYPEDIMQFVIPEVDIEIVRQINNLGYAADFLEYRASGLIREAIAEVENLIEGKLETSEIMASKLIAPTWEDIEHQLQGAHA